MTARDLVSLACRTSMRPVSPCPALHWRMEVHPALRGAEARPWRDELARILRLDAAAVVDRGDGVEEELWVVGAARSQGRTVRWFAGRCP